MFPMMYAFLPAASKTCLAVAVADERLNGQPGRRKLHGAARENGSSIRHQRNLPASFAAGLEPHCDARAAALEPHASVNTGACERFRYFSHSA
jgi:hypothetical protein